MAASVAVLNGYSDQSHKLKSGLKSIHHHGKKRFSSDPADLRPSSAVAGSDLAAGSGDHGEDRRKQADETIRQEKRFEVVDRGVRSRLGGVS
ncbi:hypothetical protein C3L33_11965, partial [Rhododendron williamsianum]